MATYAELRQQFSNDSLRQRVTVACIIAANDLLGGTPTDGQKTLAREIISSPERVGTEVTKLVIAANKDATVAQIESASDATIQTQVDAVLPKLVI